MQCPVSSNLTFSISWLHFSAMHCILKSISLGSADTVQCHESYYQTASVSWPVAMPCILLSNSIGQLTRCNALYPHIKQSQSADSLQCPVSSNQTFSISWLGCNSLHPQRSADAVQCPSSSNQAVSISWPGCNALYHLNQTVSISWLGCNALYPLIKQSRSANIKNEYSAGYLRVLICLVVVQP